MPLSQCTIIGINMSEKVKSCSIIWASRLHLRPKRKRSAPRDSLLDSSAYNVTKWQGIANISGGFLAHSVTSVFCLIAHGERRTSCTPGCWTVNGMFLWSPGSSFYKMPFRLDPWLVDEDRPNLNMSENLASIHAICAIRNHSGDYRQNFVMTTDRYPHPRYPSKLLLQGRGRPFRWDRPLGQTPCSVFVRRTLRAAQHVLVLDGQRKCSKRPIPWRTGPFLYSS